MVEETETTSAAAAANGGDKKETNGKMRRAKSFKRIRGFLTGESRKERRARKEADAAKKDIIATSGAASKQATSAASKKTLSAVLDASAMTSMDTDESTVYGVQVDDRSTSTNSLLGGGGGSYDKAANLLSTSLEEDSKNRSSDSNNTYLLKLVLLLMDPETRRFELLQLEFDSNKACVADVLAQIPLSVTEEALRQQFYTGVTSRDGKEMTPDKFLSDFCVGNDVLVAVPEGLPAKECARLAKPILSDDKVISMVRYTLYTTRCYILVIFKMLALDAFLTPRDSPTFVLLQLTASGIDPKLWKEKKKPKTAPNATPKDPPVKPSSSTKPKSALSGSSQGTSKFTVLFILFVCTVGLRILHMYFSAPIKPGHVVSPGIMLSKCGLFGVVPGMAQTLGPHRFCLDNASMRVEADKVSMHDGNNNLVWVLHGNPCPTTTTTTTEDECVNGLEFKKDKTLAMGGKPIKWLETFTPMQLSPWPFAEEPIVKTWKAAAPHKAT